AGARRTDTAYPRLLKRSHAFDQFLLGAGPHPMSLFPGNNPVSLEQLRAIPQVADLLTAYFFDGPEGSPRGVAPPNPRMDRSFNSAKVVSGRLPSIDRTDEVGVPVAIATRTHARVGGAITVKLVKDAFSDHPTIVPTTFTVVGLIAVPGEFPPE